MDSVILHYLQELRKATLKPGVYAYRGQSRAEWQLHSAATRRLTNSLGNDALNDPGFPKVYIDYHRETLVDAARTRGFGVETGRDISELQLLAKLQHFGAATGLLDFTWNPLIALWFACRETVHDNCDGKLFVLNVNDPIQAARVSSDPGRQTIDAAFMRTGNAPGLLYWEPMWSGDAMPRILRQRGVFIIGRPLIPSDGQAVEEVEILASDKEALLYELALLDISESSMFPDIYGFSAWESATASTHVKTPEFYLVQGNQHYQAGNYLAAIASYDNCIDLSPGVGELHVLRGNAKSAEKLYREAVEDYRQAIVHQKRPSLHLGHIENSPISDLMLFTAYFNCGNAQAELFDYEAALGSYSDAIKLNRRGILNIEQALFNRGNTHLDLAQFEEAICDYDAALSIQSNGTESPWIPFNKGNALVAIGQFNEALECYRLAEDKETGTKGPSQNRETLEKIMSEIGPREYQSRFLRDSDAPLDCLVVQVEGSGVSGTVGVFQGRAGNIGNLGWNGSGGKGFGGRFGFIVMLEAKSGDGASINPRHSS